MRRREFIAGMVGAVAGPLVVRAQQPGGVTVIGFLHSQSPDSYTAVLARFLQSLNESGYVEGKNLAIEYRWANDQLDRLPALAADLVRRRVAVIVAGGGSSSTLAAKAATTTIPIVLVTGSDPVALGLVASLNRPGGNITGVTFITSKLAAKRLGLLHDLVPQAATIAYFAAPQYQAGAGETDDVLAAARALGLQVIVVEARSDGDFEVAFATLVERRAGALLVGAFPLFTNNRDKLVALAARHKIPAMYQNRDYAVDGGLLSYGASQEDAFRLGGVYVGQILKGAKPAELPVQQSVRFEFVINVKTANALGLTIPPGVLAIADEVIE
jgi:putative tryptophan/tyrosine transport system substrate-binding protein